MPDKLFNKALWILFLFSPVYTQITWTEDSFEDFRDGTFTDGGSNLYVSAKGRMQMITRWDFNDDGNLDILLAAGHGHTEKENIFLYLNNGSEIDARSRIELPGGGSRDGLVYDFNKDGYNDIAIANAADSHFSRVNAWIYFGSEEGFLVENRIALPAFRGRAVAVGDFNNDSWPDLAIACQWQAGTVLQSEGPTMSFIYWNSAKGFDPHKRMPLLLEGNNALDLLSTDLDNDDIDDLAILTAKKTYFVYSSSNDFNNKKPSVKFEQGGSSFAAGNVNNDDYKDIVICKKSTATLYLGSKKGFSDKNSTMLEVSRPLDIAMADIDKNGKDEIIVANYATSGGAQWTDSYIFSFEENTINNPVRTELPTLGATCVAVADLNNDGFPEIVFGNQRVTNQLNINSYVYWNDEGKLYFGNHTQLPTLGVMAATIGDVNNDEQPDVLFFNEEGYFRDGATISKIHWGTGTRDFSGVPTTDFYTHHIFGQGHADLDDDGKMDIVLSQERFVSTVSHEQNGLILYWGKGQQEFDDPTLLTMNTAYGGVRIADINKDGYLDLLAGGDCVDPADPEKHGLAIFWGSEKGYQNHNRQIIRHSIEKMRAPLLMDLNRDGWLDITAQENDGKIKIWWGSASGYKNVSFQEIDLQRPDHLMYIKGADLNKDGWLDLLLPKRRPHQETNTSLIYYGAKEGFSNNNRIEIASNIAYENTICDFNKDGWLDIFLTSYGTDLKGNRPSVVHWGSADGFNKKPYLVLKTNGSSSSEGLDYDGDGWIDVLVANHRKAGSTVQPIPHKHTTPAQLYWGNADGFSDDKQTLIPAVGPSGMNIRDLGNSYDRGLYEDYISSAYQVKEGEPQQIFWQAETPHNTSIKFQLRVADDKNNLESAPWLGSDGENSWYKISGSKIKGITGKWLQYRARFVTPNGGPTAYLTSVKFLFE